MIKVLIIEDELPARKKIIRFLEALEPPIAIVGEIDTVETGIAFLNNNSVDVIFSDIELLDGTAFEIYSQVSIKCPIIFTTAYDRFWMEAFDTNGIAYLLKPFSKERFHAAWDKFLLLRTSAKSTENQMDSLLRMMEQKLQPKTYKGRFTIHSNHKISFLQTADISYFEAVEGVIFAIDHLGKQHLLRESTLKEIEEVLNPADFFRINRSVLVQRQNLEKIERYDKNTLVVKLKGSTAFLKTSQSSTAAFREWLEE